MRHSGAKGDRFFSMKKKMNMRFSVAQHSGFTMVELVVVVAIMALLGGLLAPNLFKYISDNRRKGCMTIEENILDVYQKCVYDGKLNASQAELQLLIDEMNVASHEIDRKDSAGNVIGTRIIPQQYLDEVNGAECPSQGTYSATIDATNPNVIIIHCSEHGDSTVDMTGWVGVDRDDLDDDPVPFVTPSPLSVVDDDMDVTPTPEEPEELYFTGVWPYAEDSRWDGARYGGSHICIKVPSQIFESREGDRYVIIDRGQSCGVHGAHNFQVNYEWCNGPEYVGNWEHIIPLSGTYINWDNMTEEEKSPWYSPNTTSQIDGACFGDIILYGGREYVYGHQEENAKWVNLPTGQNAVNNWYFIGN